MRVPVKPPVITTKCCKAILGCETCVNTWYSGTEASCPLCKAPRGYSEALELDNFLLEVAKIEYLDNEGQGEESDN